MTSRAPLSSAVFATIGAALLVLSVVLAALGSFAYLAAAAVGLLFVAAALVARRASTDGTRAAGVLGIVALALIVFGLVATPLFYAGWIVAGGSALLALITLARERREPR